MVPSLLLVDVPSRRVWMEWVRGPTLKALLMDAGLSAARIRTVTEGAQTPQAAGKGKRKDKRTTAAMPKIAVTIGSTLGTVWQRSQ